MWRDFSLFSDVRHGARLLVRQRGFSAIAMLTTALAIGVTATLVSVCDAVLWRPLSWPQADRLVRFTETHPGATRDMPLAMTNSAYLALADLTTIAWRVRGAGAARGRDRSPHTTARLIPPC
jgi:putative ABC transport system permease protein